MQPVYVTQSSSGSSLWKVANWQMMQQISFTVLSTGGSSWSIDVCYEDPTGTYRSPISSAPTPFTIATGSANATVSIGTNSSVGPIAGYRFNLNTPSSAGASATMIALQAGIG